MNEDEDEFDDFDLDGRLRLAVQQVPWKRKGTPGGWKDSYQHKWGPYFANTGVYPERLFSDQQILSFGCAHTGVEERAFAQMWDHYNNGRSGGAILSMILSDPKLHQYFKDDSDEILAQKVAQSVIQWLGTNIGRGFVDSARKFGEEEVQRLLKMLEGAARLEAEKAFEIFKRTRNQRILEI